MTRIDCSKVLTSKTLWLNVIAVIIFIVQSAQGQLWIPAQYQALVLGVLNLIMRFLTNDSLLNPPKEP